MRFSNVKLPRFAEMVKRLGLNNFVDWTEIHAGQSNWQRLVRVAVKREQQQLSW
jgi:dissimilatory sulfite reductase (desulfoviridin) alpha/beta subunit